MFFIKSTLLVVNYISMVNARLQQGSRYILTYNNFKSLQMERLKCILVCIRKNTIETNGMLRARSEM